MNADTLKEDLKSGNFHRLYLLYGDENYLKEAYIGRIAAKAVAKGTEGFNLHRFDGDAFDLHRFESAVESVPVLGGCKCVIVRDLDPDGCPQAIWKDFMSILGEIPEGCVVVVAFDAVRPDPRKSSRFKALAAAAEKLGAAAELKHPTPAELEKWAYKRIAKSGCAISPACLSYLVEICGDDMNRLSGELRKFCACADGGEITREMVDGLAARPLNASVYDLARAVVAGNAKKALRLLDELFYRREEPVAILATLSGAFCDLYRARAALDSGAGAAELTRDFNYKGREFRARNALRDCRPADLTLLGRCVGLLFEADGKLKGSRTDSRVLLEQLIVRMGALYGEKRGKRA